MWAFIGVRFRVWACRCFLRFWGLRVLGIRVVCQAVGFQGFLVFRGYSVLGILGFSVFGSSNSGFRF